MSVAIFNTSKKQLVIFLGVICSGSIGMVLLQNTWGLQGQYYPNLAWEGSPVVSKIDRTPYVKGETGYKLLGTNQFSVKWSGWLAIAQTGRYKFATNSDDGSLLWLDGQEVVNNGGAHGLQRVSGEIHLEKGVHPIEIRYLQIGGFSFMQTLWTPPGESENPIPVEVLFAKRPSQVSILFRKGVILFASSLKMLWGGILTIALFLLFRAVLRPYRIHWNVRLFWVSSFCGLTFWVSYFSPVDYSGFDPLGNLVTAQTILQHGTVKLDAAAQVLRATGYIEGWHLSSKNGHVYYHFPLGTPLYALPFVWLANLRGADMTNRMDDAALQNTLSALTVALTSLLIYLLCRCYLGFGESLLFSAAFVFGSSITSTMGTALYNLNLTVVFVLLSLLLVVSADARKSGRINPYLLGVLMFSAYLCRPTAAIFNAALFLYIFIKKRPLVLKLFVTYGGLCGLFVLFSLREYQQVLPDYYLPSKLGPNAGTFWLAMYANLVSPGRGILVYSPYLLLTFIGAICFCKRLVRKPFFWIAVGWFGAHFIVMARNFMWSGGASLGNRVFTDGFPALILLTLVVWNVALPLFSRAQRRLALGVFMLLTGISIFFNTYQGLYNPYTMDWGDKTEHLLSWQYPQFLANHHLLAERDIHDQQPSLQPYTLGAPIDPESHTAIFASWYWVERASEGKFRWSRGPTAKILFRLNPADLREQDHLILELRIGAYQKQPVDVFFNGQKIGNITHAEFAPATYMLPVTKAILNVRQNPLNEYHTVEFVIPNAVNPAKMVAKGWVIAQGISLFEMTLRLPVPGTSEVPGT